MSRPSAPAAPAELLARAGLVEPPQPVGALRLVIAGTADLHGHVRGWDYYRDVPDRRVGLSRVATLVSALRAHYGSDRVVLLDAGDTVQGSPLTWYAATGELPGPHPMATAMRELGYTAAALGNHDVEYGFDLLDRFAGGVDFPVLGANSTGPHALAGSLTIERSVAGFPPIRVGVVGLTNPGIAVWTKDVVAGRLEIGDIVAAGQAAVDELAGADVVVATVHAGTCPFSSYGDALPWLENAAVPLAEQVPAIDAVLAGHAHADIDEIRVPRRGAPDAVVTEPGCFGRRLSVMHLDLVPGRDGWQLVSTHAQLLDASVAGEDPAVVAAVRSAHEQTRRQLGEVLGAADRPLDLADAPWRANAGLELIAQVIGAEALPHLPAPSTGAPRTGVVAVVSPLRRQTRWAAGPIRARDLAALYRFDNRLAAVELTGAQLRDYLEWSARYFRPARPGEAALTPERLLRNPVPDAPSGLPDYDYDVAIGVDGPLGYDVDCARPIGDRVRDLRFRSAPVRPDDRFEVIVTGYRANGSRNYPHVATAPVHWRSERFVRAMLHDHVRRTGLVRLANPTGPGWRLTVDGVPVAGTVTASSPAAP